MKAVISGINRDGPRLDIEISERSVLVIICVDGILRRGNIQTSLLDVDGIIG